MPQNPASRLSYHLSLRPWYHHASSYTTDTGTWLISCNWEGRKLNLIIHGIPESTSESPADRKAHDIKQVSEIFSELLEVKTTVQEAVRLGKRDSSSKRLIKVSVSFLAVKKAV